MKDNDLQDSCYNNEYKRLIAEAYPSPKGDIHAAVMAKITAEAVQNNKKRTFLTRSLRNRLVKVGGMAACLVLLATLGFRVVPMMNGADTAKTADTADTASTESAVYYADSNTETMSDTTAAVEFSAGAVTTEELYDDLSADESAPENESTADGNSAGEVVMFSATYGGFRAIPDYAADEDLTGSADSDMIYASNAESDDVIEEAVEEEVADIIILESVCESKAETAEEAPCEESAVAEDYAEIEEYEEAAEAEEEYGTDEAEEETKLPALSRYPKKDKCKCPELCRKSVLLP